MLNFEVLSRIGFTLLIITISGCVTTQERPDGSTQVKLHFGLTDQAADASKSNGNSISPQKTTETNLPQSTPSLTPLLSTKLAALFMKYPYDGTTKSQYPRVALTITDWSRSDCWAARAKIWWSVSKSEAVEPFSVCFGKQSLGFAMNSAVNLHLFMEQTNLQHTGNVRTEGPKPPMFAVPDQHPINIDRVGTEFNGFIQQVIAETGWQGGAPTNFWIVSYDSKFIETKKISLPNSQSQFDQAKPALIRYFSCKPAKNETLDDLEGVLNKTLTSYGIEVSISGESVKLPQALEIEGVKFNTFRHVETGGVAGFWFFVENEADRKKLITAFQLKRTKSASAEFDWSKSTKYGTRIGVNNASRYPYKAFGCLWGELD